MLNLIVKSDNLSKTSTAASKYEHFVPMKVMFLLVSITFKYKLTKLVV